MPAPAPPCRSVVARFMIDVELAEVRPGCTAIEMVLYRWELAAVAPTSGACQGQNTCAVFF